jgi:hypothetical protein
VAARKAQLPDGPGRPLPPGNIIIMIGPDIEPVRPSVRWFTGPAVKNWLNRWFDCFGPDKLNRSQILQTGVI